MRQRVGSTQCLWQRQHGGHAQQVAHAGGPQRSSPPCPACAAALSVVLLVGPTRTTPLLLAAGWPQALRRRRRVAAALAARRPAARPAPPIGRHRSSCLLASAPPGISTACVGAGGGLLQREIYSSRRARPAGPRGRSRLTWCRLDVQTDGCRALGWEGPAGRFHALPHVPLSLQDALRQLQSQSQATRNA